MDKLKYYTIILDGIDKTGKDTIAKYVWHLDKRLNVFCRGWPSLEVYNQKFNRNVQYDLPYKNAIYVKLSVEKDDWQIRCNTTNEPKIDFEKDNQLFDAAFAVLQNNDYTVLTYNTSYMTPYEIAVHIVAYTKSLNREETNNNG